MILTDLSGVLDLTVYNRCKRSNYGSLIESTKKHDRWEKMKIYRKMEIDEYWIVDY